MGAGKFPPPIFSSGGNGFSGRSLQSGIVTVVQHNIADMNTVKRDTSGFTGLKYLLATLIAQTVLSGATTIRFSLARGGSKSKFRSALGLLIVGGLLAAQGRQVDIHDPAMAKEGDTYYLFSTDPGIKCYSSKDMKNWKFRARVFPGDPSWARGVASRFNGHIWAPDIIQHDGKYYLYYAVSSPAQNSSAIGLTINKTLNPDSPDYKWEDQGIVLRSIPGRDLWNAIDPNVIVDESGTPWMSFGSFWSGLKLVKLDSSWKADRKSVV